MNRSRSRRGTLNPGFCSVDNGGMTSHDPTPSTGVPAPVYSRPRAATLTRYAGYGAAWVLFITVARLIVPQSSQAADGPDPSPMVAATPTGHDMGSFVGREFVVRVFATPMGPRYTVCRPDGTVLRENLDGAALAATFPTLDTVTKQAEPTRLMQADIDD